MQKRNHVIIFEAQGGSDKGSYGYRPDSMPIVKALKERNWTAEIVFYSDESRGEIYRYACEFAAAYISRINPGNLADETGYFQMLRELVARGVQGLPHPDAMTAYGAKNALTQLTLGKASGAWNSPRRPLLTPTASSPSMPSCVARKHATTMSKNTCSMTSSTSAPDTSTALAA